MMRETRKSLKIYFIVVGVLHTLSGIGLLLSSAVAEKFSNFFAFVIGLFFIYFGIKINEFLDKSPQKLINFIVTVSAISVLSALLERTWFAALFFAVVGWYLMIQVKKNSHLQASKKY